VRKEKAMEQLEIVFSMDEDEADNKAVEPVRFVEVCDLPYCSEPDLFYDRRMMAGFLVGTLREEACRLFGKPNEQLSVRDLKMVFLKMCPIKIDLGGDEHEVTAKKYAGTWVLSCNCPAWIFNLSGKRICKHTDYVENLMGKEERAWGIK
jgi:hypothetical protein